MYIDTTWEAGAPCGSRSENAARPEVICPQAAALSEFDAASRQDRRASVRFDAIAAGLALALLAPLAGLIALAIALAGQRPIFSQDRVGKDGALFRIYKFRTIAVLAPGAEAASHRLGAFRRIAAVLRRTGLDEIPQLWNVMRGDMAFIGPRPLTLEDFEALPPGRELRTRILPGITGLAQVNGGQRLDSASKLAYDIYYAQRRSLSLKLYIVGLTIVRLLGGNAITDRTSEVIIVKALRSRV